MGGDAPVMVQSMTNTDTADIASTVKQVAALARAGSEVVRVTVNNEAAAEAVRPIVDELAELGIHVPIVGDFHYNGHLLLKKFPECARALAKYRINPGNVSIGRKNDDNFRTMIECAIENHKPVRIGVNWGSLDQQLLARLMDENAKLAIPEGPTRGDDRGDDHQRAALGGAGGELRTAGQGHSAVCQGKRRAGPGGRLSRAGRALRVSVCIWD